MKKNILIFLLPLMLLTGIFSEAQSLTGSHDTLCLPVDQVRKLLTAAEQKKVLQERIQLLEQDKKALDQRIAEKEFIVNDYKMKDETNQKIVKEMKDQRQLIELDIAMYKNQIKRLKRKSRWVAISGALAAIASFGLGSIL